MTLESDELFRRTYKLDSILQTDRVNVGLPAGDQRAQLLRRQRLSLRRPVPGRRPPPPTPTCIPVIDYNYILGTPVLGGQLSFTAHARAMTRNRRHRQQPRGRCRGLEAQDDRSHRSGVDAVRQLRAAISTASGTRTTPITPAPILPTTPSCVARRAAGLLYSYPFVAHTGSASHVIEPTAQIIVRPNSVRSAHAAGRGRAQPGVRRHAAVRHRPVLRLRPVSRRARAPTSVCSTRCRPSAGSSPASWSARACTWRATTPSPTRLASRA